MDPKPIKPKDRRVKNIFKDDFTAWESEENPGTDYLQINAETEAATGFHIYRMAAGSRSDAHEHMGHEEFFIISGDLTDNDGTEYKEGDLVWLRKGTEHYSTTKNGCILAVYIPVAERNL